jgi:hypothetical protein
MNDDKLKHLFASMNEDLSAGDFRHRVLRRVRRRVLMRRAVLAVAAGLGIAIAAGPLLDVFSAASRESAELVMRLAAMI